MPNPTRRVLCSAGLTLLITGGLCAPAADERAMWDLWQTHTRLVEDHAAVVAACRAFVAERPDDPFVAVSHSLESWHLFKDGRTADAVAVLEPYLSKPGGEIAAGASILAKSWMTRLDRDRLVEALQAYYREEVRYPPTLQVLLHHGSVPGAGDLPSEDRFGVPWHYSLVGYEGVPGFRDQRYRLESALIQSTSDFREALGIPYGGRIGLIPDELTTIRVRGEENVLVHFVPTKPTAKKGVTADGSPPGQVGLSPKVTGIMTGGRVEDVFLAFVGRQVIVVCDDQHWKVFPRP